MVATLEYIKLL